jgi:sortase A
VARVVGGVGKAMIAAGVLILLFVAYQLWGTSLQTARAQDELESEFEEEQAEAEAATTTTTTAPGSGATPTSIIPGVVAGGATRPATGEAAGRIEIPRIGVDDVFVSGVSVRDLKRGPGHYPDTPLPGEAGNAAIAGHRTTYGAPFNRIDELEPGDEILTTTVQGTFVYRVRETFIVRPDQSEVLAPTTVNQLTLTSCHPKYSARQRIIVVADLVGQPVAVPLPPAEGEAPQAPGGPSDLDVAGEPASKLPAVLWGAVCASIAVVSWLIARRFRRRRSRALIYVAVAPVFLVALFVLFENFSRLLPPSF